MQGFSGFPIGKVRVTSIPNLFFSDLLPQIDHLGELKVTLYSFWALSQQDQVVRFLRLTDYLRDMTFMKGMGATPTEGANELLKSLERAVARGTLLHVVVETADGNVDLYFMNTPKGRAAVEGILQGEWRPALGRNESPIGLMVERPNLFVLYEQNIGALTPIISDELREAEMVYPNPWFKEAIELAVINNARNWRYVRAILERWRQQGKANTDNRGGGYPSVKVHETADEYKDLIMR